MPNIMNYITFKALKKEIMQKVCINFIAEIFEIVFGCKFESISKTKLLTDFSYRKKELKNPRCIWRNDNRKHPIISKTSGEINIYLNDMIRKYIHCNEKILNVATKLYGTDKIVFKNGLDRPIIKPKESKCSFIKFNSDDAVKFFIHGFGKIKKYSGELKVLQADISYCKVLYYYFKNMTKIRSNIYTIKKFKEIIKKYTKYYYTGVGDDEKIEYIYEKLMIKVPRRISKIEWKTVDSKPGDGIVILPYVPYYTEKNTTIEPKIYYQLSLYPLSDEEWYNSKIVNHIKNGLCGDWEKEINNNLEEHIWRQKRNLLDNWKSFNGINPKFLKIYGIVRY